MNNYFKDFIITQPFVISSVDYFKYMFYGDFLQIEPTTRCNLHCVTCTHRDGLPTVDLSLETLTKILKNHRKIRVIKLQGLGEPFMHPQFCSICEAAAKFGPVITTTNGMFIDFEAVNYMSHITVSLDTLQQEKAEKIKGKGYNLDQILENISNLSSMLPVSINFVQNINNYNETSKILEFGKINNLHVSITPVQNWYGPDEEGYADAHERILLHRKIIGAQKGYRNYCSWLHGRSSYYNAEGQKLKCCIRMKPGQELNPRCCETCPD